MLDKTKQQFQKEQDQLLQTILDLRFFLPWKDKDVDMTSLQLDSHLEIFITNECNKRCKYCYLWKNKGLYPQDKLDHKLLLNNLKLLYDWILENNFCIPEINFFTGEIWQSQFGLDILDLTLNYIKNGMNIGYWMIPSNCSFINDDIQAAKIQNYIDDFYRYNSPLIFSISVDGAPIEADIRPNLNKIVFDNDYYDKLFSFAKHNDFCFHPMVSAKTVHKWIETHKWWEEQLKKYDCYSIDKLMLLEVRNDDWTEETIKEYNKFIEYLLDKYLHEVCHDDIPTLTKHLFSIRDDSGNLDGYIPFCPAETDTFIGCTQATDLTIRLGDLAICPCHRMSYDKYIYGYLNVENNKITNIIANNPQIAVKILMANFNLCSFGCDSCIYNKYCLKGCHGMQCETMGDPFIPNPTVCKFFKAKYSSLIEKYKKLGVIEYLKTITKYEKDYEIVKNFLTLVENYEKNGSE